MILKLPSAFIFIITISSLYLKIHFNYDEIITYIILFVIISLLGLQIYNNNFAVLLLSLTILVYVLYNNQPITYSGDIDKKEEIFSLVQLTNTKRGLIIAGNKKEKLVCKPIKIISPNVKYEQKKAYLILDNHFVNTYDSLLVKGVLHTTSESERPNFLKPIDLKPIKSKKISSTLFFNKLKIKPITKSFLKAFMFGDKNDLKKDHINIFVHSGTMHLFAVSGLHIGCLYIAFVWLFKIVGFKQNVSLIITLMILLGYLYLVNFSISSTRAYIMLCIWIVSKLLGVKVINICVISTAGVCLILYDTESFGDIGYLLSITVVLTIIWSVEAKKNQDLKSHKIYTWIIKLFQVNYSAFWGSFLILAKCFGIIVPVSLLSNLFLLPIVSIIMPISIFSIIVLNLVNSTVLATILDYLVIIIIQLCLFFSEFTWSYYKWQVIYPINFSDFYIFIILLLISYRRSKSFLICLIVLPTVVVFLLIF